MASEHKPRAVSDTQEPDRLRDYEPIGPGHFAANRRTIFAIEFTSKRLYHLLKILEDNAVKADHYHQVEELVEMAMYVRNQAKEQGL
jgi:hypothetical protein